MWQKRALDKMSTFEKPQNLIIEITETGVKRDLYKMTQFIEELHKYGVKVAIDDFGNGNTSFQDLSLLNPDFVKFSKFFVNQVEDIKMQNILKVILETSDLLGIKFIAECIENEKTFNLISEIGIKYMQGYYINDMHPNSPSNIQLNINL
jgi:EAL domain-containing protein (putative c-di-GMP-specific phosphodiesterase class I)